MDRERDHRVWRELQASWVRGSSRKRSVLLKIAVKEEFRSPGITWKPGKQKLTPEQIAEARLAVRRMYEETQQHLREEGVSSVRLYRGVRGPVRIVGALEAWSSEKAVAAKWAEYGIMEADVAAGRVVAYSQGPGWENGPHGEEFEYLVLAENPK